MVLLLFDCSDRDKAPHRCAVTSMFEYVRTPELRDLHAYDKKGYEDKIKKLTRIGP